MDNSSSNSEPEKKDVDFSALKNQMDDLGFYKDSSEEEVSSRDPKKSEKNESDYLEEDFAEDIAMGSSGNIDEILPPAVDIEVSKSSIKDFIDEVEGGEPSIIKSNSKSNRPTSAVNDSNYSEEAVRNAFKKKDPNWKSMLE